MFLSLIPESLIAELTAYASEAEYLSLTRKLDRTMLVQSAQLAPMSSTEGAPDTRFGTAALDPRPPSRAPSTEPLPRPSARTPSTLAPAPSRVTRLAVGAALGGLLMVGLAWQLGALPPDTSEPTEKVEPSGATPPAASMGDRSASGVQTEATTRTATPAATTASAPPQEAQLPPRDASVRVAPASSEPIAKPAAAAPTETRPRVPPGAASSSSGPSARKTRGAPTAERAAGSSATSRASLTAPDAARPTPPADPPSPATAAPAAPAPTQRGISVDEFFR